MRSTLGDLDLQDLVLVVVLTLFDEVAHEGFHVNVVLEILLLDVVSLSFRLPGSLPENAEDFVFAEVLGHVLHLLLQLVMLLLQRLVHRKLGVKLVEHLVDLLAFLQVFIGLVRHIFEESCHFSLQLLDFRLLKVLLFQLTRIIRESLDLRHRSHAVDFLFQLIELGFLDIDSLTPVALLSVLELSLLLAGTLILLLSTLSMCLWHGWLPFELFVNGLHHSV